MSDTEWVHKWIDKAERDLLVAKHVFHELHPKQLDISCYHCQQAAEKALKAYLIYKDYEFPFTHDCGILCVLCAKFDDRFDKYATDCSELTLYATRTRYPEDEELSDAETESALRKAEQILTFVGGLINPPEEDS